MAEDGDVENGGALLSDPVDVVIDKLLRYGRTGSRGVALRYVTIRCIIA